VAELGVAVLRPNVRGSTGYGKTYTELDNGGLREGAVRDISTLLDWIALQPALDARRVAVFGEGYGAFLALAVAVRDGERLAAAVDVGGIHDLVGFVEEAPEHWRDRRRFEYGDERVPEIREQLESLSPTRHALDIRVPLLIARGAVDPRVPAGEAEAFVAAVRAHGGELWCFEALDERHGFEKPQTRELFSQAVAMFLTEHLLPEPAER
jgi:dipeptidyl aminopeptidase/acylaminoacyl peptidase